MGGVRVRVSTLLTKRRSAALAERRALEVDKLSDQLRFASDDKQNLLAEKKKQYEKLDTERAEQVASLEAKMTELAARLKTKHTQWTEAAAERDRLAAAVEERNATSSKLQAECEALGGNEWRAGSLLQFSRHIESPQPSVRR